MKLTEEFYQIPIAPERHLKMTYAQLNACGMDFDLSLIHISPGPDRESAVYKDSCAGQCS